MTDIFSPSSKNQRSSLGRVVDYLDFTRGDEAAGRYQALDWNTDHYPRFHEFPQIARDLAAQLSDDDFRALPFWTRLGLARHALVSQEKLNRFPDFAASDHEKVDLILNVIPTSEMGKTDVQALSIDDLKSRAAYLSKEQIGWITAEQIPDEACGEAVCRTLILMGSRVAGLEEGTVRALKRGHFGLCEPGGELYRKHYLVWTPMEHLEPHQLKWLSLGLKDAEDLLKVYIEDCPFASRAERFYLMYKSEEKRDALRWVRNAALMEKMRQEAPERDGSGLGKWAPVSRHNANKLG
jgi:hypothetical protein